MDSLKTNNPILEILKTNIDRFVPYRRCVVLSELQTPCSPIVCRTVLPDPLTIDCISKIQKKLFLCISYSSYLPCLHILEDHFEKSKNDPSLRPFVDYEGALTLLTFNSFFINDSIIQNNEYVFFVNSQKYILNDQITKKVIDLVKPSLSVVPCEILMFKNRKHIGNKKKERMNLRYESYYKTILDCTNTHLINVNNIDLNFKDGKNLPGVDLGGLGYGESLYERGLVINQLLQGYDNNKLRVIQLKTGTPLEVLHAVLLGIDIVVSPYPEILSGNGKALCFDLPDDLTCDINLESVLIMLNDYCNFYDDEYNDFTTSFIDLNDNVYSDKVNEKLHEESIRNESRSYVNHLLVCKEMSANIILSIHNLYMYEKLFQKIRDCIEKDTLVGFVYNFIKINLK